MELDGSTRGDARGIAMRWVLRLLFAGIGVAAAWLISATAANAAPLSDGSSLLGNVTAAVQKLDAPNSLANPVHQVAEPVQKVATPVQEVTTAATSVTKNATQHVTKPVVKVISKAQATTKVIDKTVNKATGVVNGLLETPKQIVQKVVDHPNHIVPALPLPLYPDPDDPPAHALTVPADPAVPTSSTEPSSAQPGSVQLFGAATVERVAGLAGQSAKTPVPQAESLQLQQPQPIPGDGNNPADLLANAAGIVTVNNSFGSGPSGVLLAGFVVLAAILYLGKSSQLRGGAVSRNRLVPVTPD